ncbi:hypothetical protein HHK36_011999 [Tetracentron sinense]|uniref:WRC domain-containing protein n=1 Tax=Tetracentron sinense TaxID=13715 RepID=A0A835DGV0_TETSI|nr:hypothetical protein HHK36_011999 [Tetracentron sinense]
MQGIQGSMDQLSANLHTRGYVLRNFNSLTQYLLCFQSWMLAAFWMSKESQDEFCKPQIHCPELMHNHHHEVQLQSFGCSLCIDAHSPSHVLSNVLQGGDEGKDADQKKRSPPTASYGRNENSSGASITAVLALPLCSSQVERWCEAEKIVPLKKRKGRYQGRVEENMIIEKERDMKVKVKAEPSKKRHEEDDVYEEDANRRRRRRKRGNVLMEGSRCSRVNGRGWRCKQMTLVGDKALKRKKKKIVTTKLDSDVDSNHLTNR